jgi:hypothetical protein
VTARVATRARRRIGSSSEVGTATLPAPFGYDNDAGHPYRRDVRGGAVPEGDRGSAFSRASVARQSYSSAQERQSSWRYARGTPCDPSRTVAGSGHSVRPRRSRRSRRPSSSISIRNGSIRPPGERSIAETYDLAHATAPSGSSVICACLPRSMDNRARSDRGLFRIPGSAGVGW